MAIDVSAMVDNMGFSFSRLKLFHQCPLKWYHSYILKTPEKGKNFFTVGRICHYVVEHSAKWVVRKTFINKCTAYLMNVAIPNNKLPKIVLDGMTHQDFAVAIYDGSIDIESSGFQSIQALMDEINSSISYEEYTLESMPSIEEYNSFFDNAVVEERCVDPEIIEDARRILNRYYGWKDLSISHDEIMLCEKKLAFSKDWDKRKFFDSDVYFRGVIDNMLYGGRTAIVTDYKSSRSMLTEEQLLEEWQTKCYVLLLYETMPEGSLDTIIIRMEYMRFLKSVMYTLRGSEIKTVAESARAWIDQTVDLIKRSAKDNNFPAIRNEHCSTCGLREDGLCPLFDRSGGIGPLDNRVVDTVTCGEQWKLAERLEAERDAIVSQCKTFIKNCDDPVTVDGNVRIGYYSEEKTAYNEVEVFKAMLSKKIAVEDFLPYFSISPSNFDKMVKRLKVSFTDEELKLASKPSMRTSFLALTEQERKKYINEV